MAVTTAGLIYMKRWQPPCISLCLHAQEFAQQLQELGKGIRTGQKLFADGLKAFDELATNWQD